MARARAASVPGFGFSHLAFEQDFTLLSDNPGAGVTVRFDEQIDSDFIGGEFRSFNTLEVRQAEARVALPEGVAPVPPFRPIDRGKGSDTICGRISASTRKRWRCR